MGAQDGSFLSFLLHVLTCFFLSPGEQKKGIRERSEVSNHDLARLGYWGAASFEGKVFFAPANLETPIGMLDTDTNTFSRIPLAPSIKSRSSEGILYLFSGATAVGPWIFFAPARADHVGVLHAETLNFTTIDMATPTATDGIDWNSVRNDRDVFSGAVTVGDRPFFVPYYGDGAEGANLRYVAVELARSDASSRGSVQGQGA